MDRRLSRRQALARIGLFAAGAAGLTLPGVASAHHRPDHAGGPGGRKAHPRTDEPADPTPTPTPTATPGPSAPRDAFLWPFDRHSPWNHPIGSGARYSGSGDRITHDLRRGAEHSVLNAEHWTIAAYRCKGPERDILNAANGQRWARLPVPDHARPATPLLQGDYLAMDGSLTTNSWADAHLNLAQGDTLYELYAARRRSDMNVEAKYALQVHDLRGSGIGQHAGHWSGTRAYGGSSFGGLIRRWELEEGAIHHALAAGIPQSALRQGYIWPATSEDGQSHLYSGSVPMGTLAALPPDFDVDAFAYRSPFGPAVARALRDHGVYVVDTAGSSGMRFYAEFPEVAGWLSWAEISSLNDDLRALVARLHAVTNNASNNIGGGGEPLAPFAPEFA